MKLGTKGRYAVTAMVDLATHSDKGPVALSDIALRQNLPIQYLEQLFAKLRKAELVVSVRGQRGGYTLNLKADEIRVADIILAVDELLQTTACRPASTRSCHGGHGRCLTHNLWEGLEHHIMYYLRSISLEDVCSKRIMSNGARLSQHERDLYDVSNA